MANLFSTISLPVGDRINKNEWHVTKASIFVCEACKNALYKPP